MVARLVVEEGHLKGLVLSFENGDEWIIGRDPDESQLVIEDALVSRKHVIARRTPEGIVIENISETNSLQINGEEADNHPYLLHSGDTLIIGNELFRFYSDSPAEGEEVTAEPDLSEDVNVATERQPSPPPPPTVSPQGREDDILNNTLIEEADTEHAALAEINFGIVETGRWLLKVIGGPNNGAEFYMQSGHSYLLGTDPHSCDIVFHDTSVSRQHAKIIVTPEDTLSIEDLKSRNGILINGQMVEGRQALPLSTIITLGTTSFVVYDREGEMQTIISPLLPSIVKVLQQEEAPKVEEVSAASTKGMKEEAPVPEVKPLPPPIVETPPPKPARNFGPLIFLSIIFGLFALAGIGTVSLFKTTEPIVVATQENANELIQQAVNPFPAVRFTFNKGTGNLLLLGHVTTAADKSQLLYNLQGLKFIKLIDDSGIIIDEYVWQEVNSVLSRNPAWKGIVIHSPAAGQFVLSGYLETRKQAEQLSSYINLNFPYLVDMLKTQIVVEEDVLNQIQVWLQDYGLTDVTSKMTNGGEVSIIGAVPIDKVNQVNQLIHRIKQIPGVRIVHNLIRSQTPEMGVINLSDQYEVTGQSRIGDKLTVVINGRILSENDTLDGMDIKKITPDTVFLEEDNTKYRIDY